MIARAEHRKNYTKVDNGYLKDKQLTLSAKGLLTVILSLPNTWSFSFRGLVAICKEGRTAVNTALKELEVAGYVTRCMARDESGKFNGYEYTINEIAKLSSPENPSPENPSPENPNTDVPTTALPSAADVPLVINNFASTQHHTNQEIITKEEILHPINPGVGLSDGACERRKIQERIEYDLLCTEYPTMQVDELVELMVEIALCRKDTIHLSLEREYPTAYVQARFKMLTRDHVALALDNIEQTTAEIHNVKHYLLSVLFDVTATMDNHYTMRVNHDAVI